MKSAVFRSDLFAREVKIKRMIDLKVSLREASELVGVSTATLCRVENKHAPDIYSYFLICKWIGKEMGFFFEDKK